MRAGIFTPNNFPFPSLHNTLHCTKPHWGCCNRSHSTDKNNSTNGTAAGRGAWTRDLVQRHKTTPKQREQHKIHESKNLRTANRFAWRCPFLHCRKSQPRHAAKTAQLHRVQLQRNCKRPPRTRRRDNKNSETASSAAHLSRSTRRPVTRTLTRQDRPAHDAPRRDPRKTLASKATQEPALQAASSAVPTHPRGRSTSLSGRKRGIPEYPKKTTKKGNCN